MIELLPNGNAQATGSERVATVKEFYHIIMTPLFFPPFAFIPFSNMAAEVSRWQQWPPMQTQL